MNNLLSVDYFRMVTERGLDFWSQVYVKIPLDSEELATRGGIFGVVALGGKEDLSEGGGKLIEAIENLATTNEHKGKMEELVKILVKFGAEGIFGWILVNEVGERMVKMVGRGKVRAIILRDGKKTTLVDEKTTAVVVGKLREDDKVVLGTAAVVEAVEEEGFSEADIESLSGRIADKLLGGSCLILMVKKMEEPPEISVVVERPVTVASEKLAGNTVVGAGGIKRRMIQAQMGLKTLREKWQGAAPLPRVDKDKRHRWLIGLGAVFLVALIFSVGLGLIKAKNDRLAADFRAVYEPWEQKRKEAQDLYSLNPVGARELLRNVKDDLRIKKARFAGGPFEGKINDFEKALETTWAKVSGEMKVSPELFFNLGLIRTNLRGDRLAFDEKTLLILDQKLGTVAGVEYSNQKSSVILGKGEGANWLDLAGFGNNLVVLKKGGLLANLDNKKTEIVFDGSVMEPVAVEVFGQAAYVVDRGASEIWRYGLTGGVVGERRRWLGVGVEADLKKVVDMAVDGDIYTLDEEGKVMRLRRGKVEKYGLTDVPSDFAPSRVAVSAEAPVIAVLDNKKSRIVLFNKENGGYMKQLMAEDLAKAQDLVWVNKETLMVLVEGKILKVGI